MLPYDFYDADLTGVPADRNEYVVFTVHSIEQVPEISPEVFRTILELGPNIEGLHFEPVGWQFRDERGLAERGGSSSAYAEENDYNRNLWPVLKSLQESGKIEIVSADPDVVGINPNNSTSFIHWRVRKA